MRSPWTTRRVYEEGIRETTRRTLLTFWNVFSFFATYADIDGWTPGGAQAEPSHVLDRWILTMLDSTRLAITMREVAGPQESPDGQSASLLHLVSAVRHIPVEPPEVEK